MKNIIFILFFLTGSAMASELTLYVLPSAKGFNWSTPKSFASSFIRNGLTFRKYALGHVWVGLKCENTEVLTGTAPVSFDTLNQLLFQQRGFAVFYHSFEGQLETSAEASKLLSEYEKEGGVNFLKIKLNEAQCKRAALYLNEYKDKNVGRHYGNALRPRHGEGSNTSSFAVSVLDVLDILDEEMKLAWMIRLPIPVDVSGPPLREEGASIFSVISHRDSWAKENEKQVSLPVWDIERMYAWVNKKMKDARDVKVETQGKMQGIVLDKSHLPAPTEPIWEQVIDPKTKQAVPGKPEAAENPKILNPQ